MTHKEICDMAASRQFTCVNHVTKHLPLTWCLECLNACACFLSALVSLSVSAVRTHEHAHACAFLRVCVSSVSRQNDCWNAVCSNFFRFAHGPRHVSV